MKFCNFIPRHFRLPLYKRRYAHRIWLASNPWSEDISDRLLRRTLADVMLRQAFAIREGGSANVVNRVVGITVLHSVGDNADVVVTGYDFTSCLKDDRFYSDVSAAKGCEYIVRWLNGAKQGRDIFIGSARLGDVEVIVYGLSRRAGNGVALSIATQISLINRSSEQLKTTVAN